MVLSCGIIVKFVGIYIIEHSEDTKIKDNGESIGVAILTCEKVITSCICLGFYINDFNSQSKLLTLIGNIY